MLYSGLSKSELGVRAISSNKTKSAGGRPEVHELSDADLDSVSGAGPLPYPDVGGGSSSGKTVDAKGGDTNGDEGGTTKDLVSSKTGGNAAYASYSTDVKVEGKNATRNLDLTNHNND